eukprot:CAMPEP_0175089396 /NCGR_PEP_ID=MMETSP0086_2-20121207/763_1 /TAXON_ID=136419 /ORGANISM="Unknown Unknown, Strain D1" /LENGTH=247 /DNA_ID=CAMNT_0016361901 /DNA_START=8 /DNA_END=747 /DNA_ORIENTATION=+
MTATNLVFLAIALLAATVQSEATPPFSFYDFFKGEWDVQRVAVALKSGETTSDGTKGHYSIQPDDTSETSLIGKYHDSDPETGEVVNEMSLQIDFTDKSSGAFKTAPISESVMDADPLFNFEFNEQNNGAVLSHGEWNGADEAFYQFQISSKDMFTITVTKKVEAGKDPEATLYLGKRIVKHQELTFYQKYGTYMLVGGFLVMRLLGSGVLGGPKVTSFAMKLQQITKLRKVLRMMMSSFTLKFVSP